MKVLLVKPSYPNWANEDDDLLSDFYPNTAYYVYSQKDLNIELISTENVLDIFYLLGFDRLGMEYSNISIFPIPEI